MMTVTEVANRLVTLCREGKYEEVYQELYSPDCVSIEPQGAFIERAEGMVEMQKKGEAWNNMLQEMHGSSVGDPIIGEDHFACTMFLDCTFKNGHRSAETELCVYKVSDGKVVEERFFYTPNPMES
ncbi:MAG: SnoaL-like domain-containing protein [Bacteroidota bacterium]